MQLAKLQTLINAVCPNNGIYIGNENDKTTWTFSALESATPEQVADAQAVIDAADLSILDDAKYIPKLAIVDRLIALGKLTDALTALNSDATKKARWDAATKIALDDADVVLVLNAIGIEIGNILY